MRKSEGLELGAVMAACQMSWDKQPEIAAGATVQVLDLIAGLTTSLGQSGLRHWEEHALRLSLSPARHDHRGMPFR